MPAPRPAGKTNKLGRPPAPSESHQFQASSDLLPTGYCTVRTPAVLPYGTASSFVHVDACRDGAAPLPARNVLRRAPSRWWGWGVCAGPKGHPPAPGGVVVGGASHMARSLMLSWAHLMHACMAAARDRPLTRRRSRGRSLRRLARLKGGRPALRGSSTTPVAPYYVLTLFFFGGHVGHSARLAATLVRWCGSRRTVAFSSAQAQQK